MHHLAIHTSGGPLVIVYDTHAEAQRDHNLLEEAMLTGKSRHRMGTRTVLAGGGETQEVQLTVSPANIAALLLVGDK